MILIMAVAAAIAYTVGGIFMKLSAGLSVVTPTFLVYLCFGIGASLQTLLTARSELGTSYILVLGLESVLAATFGSLFFQETYSFQALLGIAFVVAGVAILRTVAVPNG
jgi:small multidrug resistance pump/quaternary ammonium compound-resistance protein SugE